MANAPMPLHQNIVHMFCNAAGTGQEACQFAQKVWNAQQAGAQAVSFLLSLQPAIILSLSWCARFTVDLYELSSILCVLELVSSRIL